MKLKDEDLKNLGIRSKEKTVLNLAEDLLANNLELREFSYNFNKFSKLEIKNLAFKQGKIYGACGANLSGCRVNRGGCGVNF